MFFFKEVFLKSARRDIFLEGPVLIATCYFPRVLVYFSLQKRHQCSLLHAIFKSPCLFFTPASSTSSEFCRYFIRINFREINFRKRDHHSQNSRKFLSKVLSHRTDIIKFIERLYLYVVIRFQGDSLPSNRIVLFPR